jgi:hypothetical protein
MRRRDEADVLLDRDLRVVSGLFPARHGVDRRQLALRRQPAPVEAVAA